MKVQLQLFVAKLNVMVCPGTICPELLLHSSGRLSVSLSNKMYLMCDKRSGLDCKCFKATCFTVGLTCKQAKVAALVEKSFSGVY